MISVCIATYNGEKFIREQIDSILRQLSLDDEIIVSDDGSTDDTISIINSIDDKRIRIIEGPRKHSPTLRTMLPKKDLSLPALSHSHSSRTRAR